METDFSLANLTEKELRDLCWVVVDKSKCAPYMRDEANGVAMEALLKCEEKYDPLRATRRGHNHKRAWMIWKSSKMVIDWYREWHGYRAKVRRAQKSNPDIDLTDLNTDDHWIDGVYSSNLEKTDDDDIINAIDNRDLVANVVAAANKRLKPNAQYVLQEVLLEGRTMASVGEDLGVTESRVCQITRDVEKQVRYYYNLCMEEDLIYS